MNIDSSFIDINEMKNIINSLKDKMSSGHDELPIKILKKVKGPLLKPLVHLVNSSFVSGLVPNKIKLAKVIPLHKKGDLKNISNYRPVSLLSSISKVYEKAMYARLVHFLDTCNLFDDAQHGFRKGRSIVTAAVDFVESIIESIDNNESVIGIYMDLSKAFDSACHETLLRKLESFGIKDTPLKWFRSYLNDRNQFVEITTNNQNVQTNINCSKRSIKWGVQ